MKQGGGCYNSLSKVLGYGKNLSCIGFSAGIERCMLLSTLEPPLERHGVGVIDELIDDEQIVLLDEKDKRIHEVAIHIANVRKNEEQNNEQKLRKQGISCIEIQNGIKKALKELEKQHLQYAIFVGENEVELWKQSKVVMKDLNQHQQSEMPISEFVNLVNK